MLKQIDLYCKTIMTYGLHLALNQTLALFGMLFWNALRYLFFWLMSSAVRSFTKIYKRSFEISFLNDPLNASTLARFRNKWKSMNQGKTQCWALFVTSKANFTKIVIKTKFVDNFFKNFFSTLIDKCTIKSPSFESIENF